MAGRAYHAGAVALVHHHQCVIFLCQGANLVHGGHVAVHGKNAVRDDDAEAAGLGFLEFLFQIGHVGIGITETLGFAQAHAVNDGGMVQGVRDNGVLCAEQRLEDTAVGIEAGGVQDGVFRVEIVCNGCLQGLVDVLGAADEADGGHAVAALIHGFFGGGNQAGIVREAQVVVGAEVEGFAAVLQGDFRTLRAGDIPFFLIKTGLLDGFQFIL